MINIMDKVRTYCHGRINFIAGVCENLKVSKVFNEALSKGNGRRPCISYGTMAEMMIVNLYDSHKPLYLMKEYFEEQKDLEGIFKEDINIEKLNDDRFANFLDKFYEAEPRKIFSQISAYAFATYGLTVKNINYDTTSKVMWGEYDTPEGTVGEVSINFGHSKQKRNDKKQIKMGIGTANGIIVDAKVLSGNMDDKTYNNENLDDVVELLKRTNTSIEGFHYIADSALFTSSNILKAEEKGIKFITRVPDSLKISKELIDTSFEKRDQFKAVEFINAHKKKVEYLVQEFNGEYNGIQCKLAVCYSKSLEKTKRNTILRKVKKENEELKKINKQYAKRKFACKADAEKEIKLISENKTNKINYHVLSYNVDTVEKKNVGRPPKVQNEKNMNYEYILRIETSENEQKINTSIEQACTFVLASNNTNLSGEMLLEEYKTQSSVEMKFQQLKSPDFVNSLFLKTPQRIEALTYMMLITMMILSVVEYVVRRELDNEKTLIIGPGGIKMKRPTLRSIVYIFQNVPVNVLKHGDINERCFLNPLNDSQEKILRYLGLDENIFVKGCDI